MMPIKLKTMKHLLILFTLLILKVTPSVCQKECRTFDCAYDEAKRLFNDSKSVDRYGRALVNLEGAENLAGNDENNKRKIRELRAKIIEAITEQNRMLKKATETANTAKENSDRLLKELRETSDQAVQLLLNEIDRNILRLEYDSTYDKCRIAVNLKSQNLGNEIKKRVLEIAYWYTETDTFNAALKTLKLLNINSLPNRNDIRKVIESNSPHQYFTFVEERYYPKFVIVEGGSLISRYDSLEYEIRLDRFKIAKTETTFFQYALFAKITHHYMEAPPWGILGNTPAVNVSWFDAAFYLNWLSERQGLSKIYSLNSLGGESKYEYFHTFIDYDEKGFRLPTKAEWEFAERGGNVSKNYDFCGDSILSNVAWYAENSDNRAHDVASKMNNELGLFDMSGNILEWCADWNDTFKKVEFNPIVTNPKGPMDGAFKICCGGSYAFGEIYCKSPTYIDKCTPERRNHYLGFRVVLKD